MSATPDALLAGALAGVVAVAATRAIERWGGVAGGLLATLPTTIVPAALGIARQSADPSAFRAAMVVAPGGMLLNALFLWLWRVLPARVPGHTSGRRLAAVTATSLIAWVAAAAVTVLGLEGLRSAGLPLLPVGLALTLTMATAGVLACRGRPPAPSGRRPVAPAALVARGLLAGLAVGSAVALASRGGAVAAGVAAVFPAIFLTTMVALWLAQGEAVSVGAVGPMMLGSTSVAAFSLLAAWSIPAFGPGPGATLAWLGAATSVSLPAALWLGRRPGAAIPAASEP